MYEEEFEDRQNFSGDQQAHGWAAAIHLSQLLPAVGFVAPIVIWQMKKREIPELDGHGRNIVNWLISLLIYAVISLVLLCVTGLPPFILLELLSIVFPIVGAIKASKGKVWKYPGTITFV